MLRRPLALFPFVAPFALLACSRSPESPSDAGAAGPDGSVGVDAAGAADAATADAGACTSPEFTGSPLGVHCNQLVDGQGRTVLLHGINARAFGVFDVSFTDGRLPNEPIPPFTSEDAARIRALGFNALRLPIQWSAIEPLEVGGFDEGYLGKIAAVTSLCAAAGVLVLLDFHQDAFSKEIGEDGVPLWAILPPPTALLGGPMGGTLPDGASSPDLGARRNSAQVGSAFTTFFDADGGADGQRLRDRFTAMAAHVAARFAQDPAVFGFELFNEPVASDEAIHPLYVQMIPAMRAAAPAKLLLWEPAVLRNELDRAPEGNGTALGAGTVYAPHVYTNAFVGGNGFTKVSLATSNQNAREEADSWGAPLVITEWGYGPGGARFADYVRFQQELEDEARASAFFWLWKEESQGSWGLYDFGPDGGVTERAATVQAMARARVEAVAGALESAAYDSVARRLEVHFAGNGAATAPNLVSIGAALTPPAAQWIATCDGTTVATGAHDPLQIPCSGPGEHVLVVNAP